MSEPSQSRSITVTGLSGRVQALKFMQRGSAAGATSSTPSAPTSATSTPARQATSGYSTPASGQTSPAPHTPAASGSYGQEEEQWSLSPAKISQLTAKAQVKALQNASKPASPAKIEHEAGFEAWLLSRERNSANTSSESGATTNTRQAFGSFKAPVASETGAKRSRDHTEEESRTEPEFDIDEDSEDDDEVLSLEEGSKPPQDKKLRRKNGFIKPGALQNSGNKSGKRSSSTPSPSAKKSKSAKTRDQDRVVYTRKRGGKQGISGGRN